MCVLNKLVGYYNEQTLLWFVGFGKLGWESIVDKNPKIASIFLNMWAKKESMSLIHGHSFVL